MPSELHENSEARSMLAAVDTKNVLPSQQDMAAFWESLKLAGSTSSREQKMFGQAFSFENVESLYGGHTSAIAGDYKQTQKGIMGSVGLRGMGIATMAELKADQSDRASSLEPENQLLLQAEGLQVRNATAGHVEAVNAANPNLSDGSVQNWATKTQAEKLAHAESSGQDASLELIERKPTGKEVVIAARQMFAEVKNKSQVASKPQELADTDSRSIQATGWDYKPQTEHKVIEAGLQYQSGKPPEVTEQSLLAKIGSLPLDQQAQVLGAGIKAYSGEMAHQQFRIGVGAITGLGDGVLGLAQGAESLGKAIIAVAQFSRDVMENSPAALETAGKAGESLGKLMVGGIRVFSAAEGYLESVGAATNVGDYSKALRDVAWLGQQMNSRWEAMTPEEKTRLTTKLAVENLGGLAVGFGADKLAKSVKITEALEALGTEVSAMAPGVRDKAGKLISRLTDELLPQPMDVTPDGRLMPIPRDRFKNDANVLMSKADDLGNSGRLVSKGVDATGKALGFSKESGIELGAARLGQDKVWDQAPFPRGNDVHVGLGENLPVGTKTIDRLAYRDGIVESQKSIDLTATTYDEPQRLESKLTDYLHKLEIYKGQPTKRSGPRFWEDDIQSKILHIGISDGSMTAEQKAVFEKVGKAVQDYNENLPMGKAPIKLKVTIVK